MRIRWRGFELPSRVAPDRDVLTSSYGRFIAEPFERGFGHTIGNSLRRILLSSLEGAAVTQARIQGIQHEFTTIPGVVEDVTDIVLNLKGVAIRMDGDGPKRLSISAKGPGAVTAADISETSGIEILNKDHVICHLDDGADLFIELTVNTGKGYVAADKNRPEDAPIGLIPVDAIYSPVQRVRYKVEETRVGQKVNYDKLVLEIWTDGTITPEMAMVEAGKILRKHLNCLVHYPGPGTEVQGEVAVEEDPAFIELRPEGHGLLAEPGRLLLALFEQQLDLFADRRLVEPDQEIFVALHFDASGRLSGPAGTGWPGRSRWVPHRWARKHRWCVRQAGWSAVSRSKVQARQASRVRQHGSPDARRRSAPPGCG